MKFTTVVCLLLALFGSAHCHLDPVCDLTPAVQGRCLAYMPSFSYDSAFDTCVRFIYGGCGGNKNRFGSEKECRQRCMK